MTTTAPALPLREGPTRTRQWWWLALALLAVGVGLALRLVATSALWLDEAQTVEIARRPVGEVLSALRMDGSPPLYYVVLHAWIGWFGTGTTAVRSLSALCSLLTVPVVWWAARRLFPKRAVATAATVLVATSPFAIRYATETRMYALVMLLVALAVVAYHRVCSGGRWPAYVAATALTGALLLTHYWALFLYAVTAAAAAVLAWRGSAAARRALLPLAAGLVPFLPWLPTFWFQVRHTGAPWGTPPTLDTLIQAPVQWGGMWWTPTLVGIAYYALAALALTGRRRRLPALLLGAGFGSLTLGCLVSVVLSSAYAPRYSAVALIPVLLAVAAGVTRLPDRWRQPAVAALAVAGLIGGSGYPGQARTDADAVARLVAAARPADVVLFCPDQLGPAVHRLAPQAGRQLVYPTGGSAALVDWVDYAARNAAADPHTFATHLLATTAPSSTIWFVYNDGYPTFGHDCTELLVELTLARGLPRFVPPPQGTAGERDRVAVFAGRPAG